MVRILPEYLAGQRVGERRNSAFVYADERRNFGARLMGRHSSKAGRGVRRMEPYGRKGQTHKVLMR